MKIEAPTPLDSLAAVLIEGAEALGTPMRGACLFSDRGHGCNRRSGAVTASGGAVARMQGCGLMLSSDDREDVIVYMGNGRFNLPSGTAKAVFLTEGYQEIDFNVFQACGSTIYFERGGEAWEVRACGPNFRSLGEKPDLGARCGRSCRITFILPGSAAIHFRRACLLFRPISVCAGDGNWKPCHTHCHGFLRAPHSRSIVD